jgi:lactoylglutathione lyase
MNSTAMKTETNVKQAVPFLMVANIEKSVDFYVNGLGFAMTNKWIPQDKIEWCWLQYGGAALMLQEFRKEKRELLAAEGQKLGVGVSICFQCGDALAIYREVKSRGIQAEQPFVGNAMWVTSMSDSDGYKLFFESPTDAPEESLYSEPVE